MTRRPTRSTRTGTPFPYTTLFRSGRHLSYKAILASNTSSIPITRLAQASPDPARFIGVHFFNPVPVMGLIELIRGLATSDATLAAVEAFGRGLGKEIVHANRSEERRVGKECVSTCRSRLSPYH